MSWNLYKFKCEVIDGNGVLTTTAQEYIHESEEQARRELIHTLNSLYRIRPKKIQLVHSEAWEPSPFYFD